VAWREGNGAFPSHDASDRDGSATAMRAAVAERSAWDRYRQDRAMARLAPDLRGTGGYARRVAVHITPGGESHGLCIERLAIRFPAHLRFRFRIRARAGLGRAGVGLRMMAFRYTPREASQFTHGCDLFGGPLLASWGCFCCVVPRSASLTSIVPLSSARSSPALAIPDATAIPKKKSSVAELKRGTLCRSGPSPVLCPPALQAAADRWREYMQTVDYLFAQGIRMAERSTSGASSGLLLFSIC
jgi:hypothetical protein